MVEEKVREKLEECKKLGHFIGMSAGERKKLVGNDSVKMLTRGNKFLGKNCCAGFRVFNLPQGITCPERTAICCKHCYQRQPEGMMKAEGRDSAVVIRRKINLLKSLQDDFVDAMCDEIRRLQPREKQLYMRIHASGDFYSSEYLRKWFEIALRTKVQNKKNYVFVAYTKSLHIVDDVMKPENKALLDEIYKRVCNEAKDSYVIEDFNIHLLGSIMKDTSEETKELIKKYKLPKHGVFEEEEGKVLIDCYSDSRPCACCLLCYKVPIQDTDTLLNKRKEIDSPGK